MEAERAARIKEREKRWQELFQVGLVLKFLPMSQAVMTKVDG